MAWPPGGGTPLGRTAMMMPLLAAGQISTHTIAKDDVVTHASGTTYDDCFPKGSRPHEDTLDAFREFAGPTQKTSLSTLTTPPELNSAT